VAQVDKAWVCRNDFGRTIWLKFQFLLETADKKLERGFNEEGRQRLLLLAPQR
jgi:hypothetical protein